MNRLVSLILIILGFINLTSAQTKEIEELADRVTNGTNRGRIAFRLSSNSTEDEKDFYRISATSDNKVLIEGNNSISMAVGLNHYLKHVAGIHIGWNNLTQDLPEVLPLPSDTIYHETDVKNRYYLNYCTFSYSMPFWDEERWLKEIDWMALHGINMALSLTGMETVWKNMLTGLGYTFEEVTDFIPGPAYFAWWQMNNLEGWGGPLPAEWFDNQEKLAKIIYQRMNDLGISPIYPGFSGMMPRNAGEKLGLNVEDTGTWCGFPRPSFLSPEDEDFGRIADLYYSELSDLYGITDYYSMDPFHEGGKSGDVDLGKAGAEIYNAMKRVNPEAKWVIQSWQNNPKKEMIDTIPAGDLLILDLYSEKIPKWERIGGYGKHDWLYCMLLNFGGNIGMHGRINSLTQGYQRATTGDYSATFAGIGATPEGIENNPIMYELLFDLPWMPDSIDSQKWIEDYLTARYGQRPDENVKNAWKALENTVYNAPMNYGGQGTVESIICARPSLFPKSASTWGDSELFYSPDSTAKAASLMTLSKEKYRYNRNFMYDLIDIQRQANADEANRLITQFSELFEKGDTDSATIVSEQFLELILEQDSLLSIIPDTHVDSWLAKATELANGNEEAGELYRKNAAMLITVWGDSTAANRGGLHDYSHREWGGIIKELYYERWKAFFEHKLHGAPEPDYYAMEKQWVEARSKKD